MHNPFKFLLLITGLALPSLSLANDMHVSLGQVNYPSPLGDQSFDLTGIGISYHITEHFSFTNTLFKGVSSETITMPVPVAPGTVMNVPVDVELEVNWAWRAALVYGWEFHDDLELVASLQAINVEFATKPRFRNGLLDVDNLQSAYYGTGISWEPTQAQKISAIFQKSDNDNYNVWTAFYEHEFMQSWGARGLYSYYPTAHQSASFELQLYKNF